MWHWSVLYCTHQYHNDKSKTSKSARFKFKDFSKKGFFKYFQAPYLFSSTFKGLEVFIPNSSIFKDFSSMLWNHLPEAVGGRWRNVDSQSADDTAQFDVQYKPSVGHFLHCTPDVPVVRCLLEVARLRDLVNKLQQLLTHRYRPTTQRQLYRHCLSQLPSVLWRCLLGGRKGIRPVKNWAVGCWHGYLSGARCRLAYGPADATASHCLMLQ